MIHPQSDRDERTLAHAHAIRARGLAMPPDGLPPALILDSWARCLQAGLTPGAALAVPVVEAADLAHRQERAEFVRRLAQAELETLSRQIAGSNFLLAFSDSDGVILDLYADNRFAMSGADAGIVAGSLWSETVAGTNGLGTALASGHTMAVTGLEHYFLKLGDISCTAAPVRDPQGRIVGVLDASSYFESRQRHTQALVQMAATHIENGLLAHQMRGHLVLAVHPRPEFLGTLSAGLLAFEGDGHLVALNGPARNLLVGLDVAPGALFDELFGEPLDHVLARLHHGHDVRLRDAMGSALTARALARPPAGRTTGLALRAPPKLPSGPPNHVQPKRVASPSQSMSDSLSHSLSHSVSHNRSQSHSQNPSRGPLAGISQQPPAAAAPGELFLADDPAVAEACRLVQAAVDIGVPLLLQGETGTGKELLARHAHRCSRRTGEFLAVNCAAMPVELFEAELFGYVSGAFTGARREGQRGLIVAADGGTLLLDEVTELPLQLQAALLRFLDDQTVRPVGGHSAQKVNVQLLAACHADLEEEVRQRRFRQDLMYRLNTVRVQLPPLRGRSDLPQAVRWVLRSIDRQINIDADALARLAGYGWPGNFRELRSVLTRALLHRADPHNRRALSLADVAAVLPGPSQSQRLSSTAQTAPATASSLQHNAAALVRAEFERCGRSVSRTARVLAISRTTVYRHLRG